MPDLNSKPKKPSGQNLAQMLLNAPAMSPGVDMADTAGMADPNAGAAPGGAVPPAAGMPVANNADALGAMLSMNSQGADQMALKRQMAKADALRGAIPGMTQGVGGMPNYLGALASGIAAYRANKMDSESGDTATRLGREQRNAGLSAVSALTGANLNDAKQGNAASDAVADAIAKQKNSSGAGAWLSKLFGGGAG
jgi:hypothetical protein